MKRQKSLITIICPLYNKENFIIETIESVLCQTYTNWELIIVDDGSTDESVSLVGKYKGEKIHLYKRKVYEKIKNGGSVCRNIGLKKAKGDYIMFLDADDILTLNCLEKRIQLAEIYQNSDALIFGFKKFKYNINNIIVNNVSFIYEEIRYKLASNKREYMLKKFLLTDYFWQTSSVFWKKNAILKLGGFTESFLRFQDPELHIRALLDKSIKIEVLKYKATPDFYYRIEDNREILTAVEKYQRLTNHLKHFVFFINEVLSNSNRKDLLKYLGAYLLLVEIDKPIKDIENRVEIEEIYNDFYNNVSLEKYFNFNLRLYKRLFKIFNSLRFVFFKRILYWFFKKIN